MENSVSGSPTSSRLSSTEEFTVSDGGSSPFSTLRELSVSLESLVSLEYDDSDIGEPQPSKKPRLSFESEPFPYVIKNLDCFDCSPSNVISIKNASAQERMILYATEISRWNNETFVRAIGATATLLSLDSGAYKNIVESAPQLHVFKPELHIPKKFIKMSLDIFPSSKKFAEARKNHLKANKEKFELRRRELNQQQNRARTMKVITDFFNCTSYDDVQYYLYNECMKKWRDIQFTYQSPNKKYNHFWSKPRPENLELALFPLLYYSQLLIEPPPLPLVSENEDFYSQFPLAEAKEILNETKNKNVIVDMQVYQTGKK